MKKLLLVTAFAMMLFSCGREESEFQNEIKETGLLTNMNSRNSNLNKDRKSALSGNYINRHYSHSLMKHYYGASLTPIGQHNWSYEGTAFKTSQIASTLVSLAVYINPNNLDCVIATTQAERTSLEATGYVFREPIGYNSNNMSGRIPVYKYYRSSKAGHFYTTNINELGWGGNGWTYEGIAFYAEP